MIGSTVFPGMTSQDHEVMVLAVQRGGAELVRPRLTLRSGDHLLLQGSWPALERYLSSAELLVIDSPDEIRTQAVALGRGAKRVFAILALLVVLLVFNIMPAPIACMLCACLTVITRVVRLPQIYRGLDWNTVLLIGAMIAPARAMEKSGAAATSSMSSAPGFGSHASRTRSPSSSRSPVTNCAPSSAISPPGTISCPGSLSRSARRNSPARP